MGDIFISYKREDQKTARTLANALEREGWIVWWDPQLRAGEHFDDVIEKALNEAKCVIVMWSERAVQSRYVRDEATYALDHDKLVPVAIENVNLPFRFRALHTLSLLGWDGSRDFPEFRRLVDDVAAIVSPQVTEVTRNADEENNQRHTATSPWRTYSPVVGALAVVLVVFSFVFWWPKLQESSVQHAPTVKPQPPTEVVPPADQKPKAPKETLVQSPIAVLAAPAPKKPECGTVIPISSLSHGITFSWQPVEGASTYTAEVDCFGCSEHKTAWYSLATGRPWHIRPGLGLRSPIYSSRVDKLIRETGGRALRWRVWTVNPEGKEGPKSEWCQVALSGSW